MPQVSTSSYKRPRKLWWLFGFILFALFAVLQMPAAWLLEKYAPDTPYVQHVSGNLWQGSAIWQLPVSATPLTGAAEWSWQPWHLLLGKLGAEVDISSEQTRLNGQVKVGTSSSLPLLLLFFSYNVILIEQQTGFFHLSFLREMNRLSFFVIVIPNLYMY